MREGPSVGRCSEPSEGLQWAEALSLLHQMQKQLVTAELDHLQFPHQRMQEATEVGRGTEPHATNAMPDAYPLM